MNWIFSVGEELSFSLYYPFRQVGRMQLLQCVDVDRMILETLFKNSIDL